MNDEPAFEMRTPDGCRMAVWANGRTEGFPEEYSILINRIPHVEMAAYQLGYARAGK